MIKRPRSDRILARYEAEWLSSRKKMLLRKAVHYCQAHRLREPSWLHEAQYQLGRALVMRLKKTGRKTHLVQDDQLYAMVEEYLDMRVTQQRAFELTACDYFDNPKQNFTVRNAWRRHRNRIVKVDPSNDPNGFEWRIKAKYLENDKDANMWSRENVPAYLRAGNR